MPKEYDPQELVDNLAREIEALLETKVKAVEVISVSKVIVIEVINVSKIKVIKVFQCQRLRVLKYLMSKVKITEVFNVLMSRLVPFLFAWILPVLFSSPEPKAQVSFSDQNLSVVRRRCCCWRCRKLFTFSSSSPEILGLFQPNLAQRILG